MRLVLLGPPGAGKGTLANLLKDELHISHISTGDILREEMRNNTPLGQEVKGFIENGKLVPDEVVTKLIESRFTGNHIAKEGYMLDGYPRTEKQAEDLDRILEQYGQPLEYALNLDSTLGVIIHRLTGRRVCRQCGALFHMTNKPPKQDGVCDECGGEIYQRADDNEETIKTRLEEYKRNTSKIIDYYEAQGKLKTIDADQDAKDVMKSILTMFDVSP